MFVRQILNEIAQHKIRIYEFPECEDDEEVRSQRLLRERVPFAVVGANTVIEVGTAHCPLTSAASSSH